MPKPQSGSSSLTVTEEGPASTKLLHRKRTEVDVSNLVGDGLAQVEVCCYYKEGVGYGRKSLGYNVSVRLTCSQNDAGISRAAAMARRLAEAEIQKAEVMLDRILYSEDDDAQDGNS